VASVLGFCNEAVELDLKGVKCLAETLFLLVGLFEEFFEVTNALVFPFAVCSLGGSVLSSPSLWHHPVSFPFLHRHCFGELSREILTEITAGGAFL
jgi:hypothetical protein